jgi:hypothetical protein
MLIGARNASSSGAAYIFDRVGGVWMQSARLVGNDTGSFDDFGHTVDLDGDQAIVGAPSKNGPAGIVQGAAYIFERGVSGWAQVQRLFASDAAAINYFGAGLGIEGTRAVVGAAGHSHGAGNGGAAYVFDRISSVWTETQELLASDQTGGKAFGWDVEISGDHILIGAYGDDESVSATRGSAYDFRWNGSTWVQAGKMLARDAHANDLLGISLASFGISSWLVPTEAMLHQRSRLQFWCCYIFELGLTATQ